MNLIPIFLTGLFTGGLTCLAVQGGLLATTLAQRQEEDLKEETKRTGNALPILSFLIAKLSAYTVLGFLLGWLGSLVQLSLGTMTILQFAVAIFMIGTALNLLNVHPIFRYFVIQPPRFLTRMIRKESKSKNLFAPAILGAFTVFVPCGTTQAMMALAIGAANPWLGAAILFIFILGTSPLFFILGYFATRLSNTFQERFTKIAAYSLILVALYNLNGAVALTGSTVTLGSIWTEFYCTAVSFCDEDYGPKVAVAGATTSATNTATITITESGYEPSNIVVNRGSNVTLNVVNKSGRGCTQAFAVPKYGIQKVIPIGSSDTITFTAPNEPTQLTFMCSMGMVRGSIQVI